MCFSLSITTPKRACTSPQSPKAAHSLQIVRFFIHQFQHAHILSAQKGMYTLIHLHKYLFKPCLSKQSSYTAQPHLALMPRTSTVKICYEYTEWLAAPYGKFFDLTLEALRVALPRAQTTSLLPMTKLPAQLTQVLLTSAKKICTQPKRTCTYTRTHTNHTFTVSHTCTLWKFYFLMTFFVAGISGRAIEELRAVRAEGAASGQVRLCHRAQAPLYAIAITRSHLCYTYLIYHPLVDSFLFSWETLAFFRARTCTNFKWFLLV